MRVFFGGMYKYTKRNAGLVYTQPFDVLHLDLFIRSIKFYGYFSHTSILTHLHTVYYILFHSTHSNRKVCR